MSENNGAKIMLNQCECVKTQWPGERLQVATAQRPIKPLAVLLVRSRLRLNWQPPSRPKLDGGRSLASSAAGGQSNRAQGRQTWRASERASKQPHSTHNADRIGQLAINQLLLLLLLLVQVPSSHCEHHNGIYSGRLLLRANNGTFKSAGADDTLVSNLTR